MRNSLIARFILALALLLAPLAAAAAEPTPAPKAAPTLEQRVADLEAYINNSKRGADEEGAKVDTKVAGPGPGHNGWLLASAALVLFMTLPGLALFYGGLVQQKNVLSVMAQCLGIAGLVALLWWLVGYGLVFAKGGPFLGDPRTLMMLRGVGPAPNTDYALWISQSAFASFQLMFAIITPALIVGAVAERMKFKAVLLFTTLWMFAVYFPLAHMVWGADGFMSGLANADAKIKAIDFAGGTVVHMSSGWSALVLCLVLGPRRDYAQRRPLPPHSMVLCMIGTGMLWAGWYGFNAGSALAADGLAAHAFLTTTLAAGAGSFAWGMAEAATKGRASVLGFCSGAVGGLVAITPACGFVDSTAAVGIGVLAGIVTFAACNWLKARFRYDDALDTFGVHGVGGTLGAILTGLLASSDVNSNLATNLKDLVGRSLWWEQAKAGLFTVVLAVVATWVIAKIVSAVCGGLRVDEETESRGLDVIEHGEEGYQSRA